VECVKRLGNIWLARVFAISKKYDKEKTSKLSGNLKAQLVKGATDSGRQAKMSEFSASRLETMLAKAREDS